MALGGLLLVDKSAYVRSINADDFAAELCLCPVIELEILYSARSAAEFETLSADLGLFRSLRVDTQTLETARGAQRALAESGRHRIPMPDLLIAACAEQHGAGVLHVDRHYETLAEVLEFEPQRL
jgi:predicted nucleic acid-binding protein